MRIVIHDEVPESFDTEIQLMHLGASWGIFDFDHIEHARKVGYPSSDYFAVYAIEHNQPLAKVEVIHIEFETPSGPETMSGIGGVVTRRDKSRLGLARELLLDVHKREKASGIRHSLLWTGRNNKAHNLYESLGYFDIYDPGIALLKTSKQNNSGELTMRSVTPEDADLMDSLHSEITTKRLGFKKRCKDFMNLVFALEFEKPESFRIFNQNNTPIGYAQFQQNTGWIRSYEVVVVPEYFNQIVSLLETEAKGNWLAFANSFVSDAHGELTKRAYAFSDYTYGTLMACELDQPTKENMNVLLGTNNPRFVCHALDHF